MLAVPKECKGKWRLLFKVEDLGLKGFTVYGV